VPRPVHGGVAGRVPLRVQAHRGRRAAGGAQPPPALISTVTVSIYGPLGHIINNSKRPQQNTQSRFWFFSFYSNTTDNVLYNENRLRVAVARRRTGHRRRPSQAWCRRKWEACLPGSGAQQRRFSPHSICSIHPRTRCFSSEKSATSSAARRTTVQRQLRAAAVRHEAQSTACWDGRCRGTGYGADGVRYEGRTLRRLADTGYPLN
jgi:hypothetical protein